MKSVSFRNSRELNGSRSGGVLVLALVAVMTVMVMGAGYLQISASATGRQIQSIDTKRAFYLAESGLAEAYSGLLSGRTGNVGSEEQPAAFGDGLFWVEATDNPDLTRSLVSTGMCGAGRAVLSIVIEPGDPKVGTHAAFGDQSLQIGSGSVIDAYDSRFGTYADYQGGVSLVGGALGGALGAAVGGLSVTLDVGEVLEELPEAPPVEVGSNGPVWVTELERDSTEVHGNLQPGPGETLTEIGAPLITGETTPAVNSTDLPDLIEPTTSLGPGLRHSSAIPLLIQDGVIGYSYLEVAGDATVVLQGPLTVVVDDLTLEPSSELHIDTTYGEVVVFVLDDLQLQAGSIVTQGAETTPTDVLFLVSGADPVTVASDGNLVGVFYAPGATVTVDGADVFGSVVGDDVVFTNGGSLHYDQALADVAEVASLPQFLTWRIVDMAPARAATLSRDPFDILGVDPNTCPDPSRAHEDQVIAVRYESDSGGIFSYNGMESAFDWSVVKQVLSIARDGSDVSTGLADAVGSVVGAVGGKIGDFTLNP